MGIRTNVVVSDLLESLPDATVLAGAVCDDEGRVVDFEPIWMNRSATEVFEPGIGEAGSRLSGFEPWSTGLLAECVEALRSDEARSGEVSETDDEGRPFGFNWRAVAARPDVLLWVQRDISGPLGSRQHMTTADARLRAVLAQSFEGHAFVRAKPGGELAISWCNEEFSKLDVDGNLLDELSEVVARVSESGRRLSDMMPIGGRIFDTRLYPVGDEVAVTIVDQTEIFSTTAGLAHDVAHDHLTGIGNRVKLRRDLVGVLAKHGAATVLCLDLDGFKEVNDTFGHPAGDQVLCHVAGRIAGALRKGEDEEVYRLGGDEFVVIAGPMGTSAATAIASRIQNRVGEAMTVEGQRVSVTVSTGATIGTASEDPSLILERADRALLQAKRGDSVVVFA